MLNEKDKTLEMKSLIEMKKALKAFKESWQRCIEAFDGSSVDCNEFILGNEEENTQYPFNKSFDELNIGYWVDGSIDAINEKITTDYETEFEAYQKSEIDKAVRKAYKALEEDFWD